MEMSADGIGVTLRRQQRSVPRRKRSSPLFKKRKKIGTDRSQQRAAPVRAEPPKRNEQREQRIVSVVVVELCEMEGCPTIPAGCPGRWLRVEFATNLDAGRRGRDGTGRDGQTRKENRSCREL